MLDELDRKIRALTEAQLRDLVAQTPKGPRLVELTERLKRIAEHNGQLTQRSTDRTDPVGWAQRVLHAELWSRQREILEAVKAHKRVAVVACHDAGKSWLAARSIAWWLSTSEPGDARAVSSAPSDKQVRAILWHEIGLAHAAGGLAGRVNQSEWWLPFGDRDVLAGFGRKPANHDTAAFQGIHAPRMLVVFDEADGIPEQLWVAGEALITNDDTRFLVIGNPDDPTSYFARLLEPGSKEGHGWHIIRISAFDTPAFTGESVSAALTRVLLTREWVEDKRVRWGEDNPLWSSKVLAVHPKNVANAAVPWARIAVARSPERVVEDNDEHVLGVDVGGGGDDTVVCERKGWVVVSEQAESTPEPEQVYEFVLRRIVETGASKVQIDSGGIGWGVVGMLREAAKRGEHGAEIVPVNAGSAATHLPVPGEPGLANMRSQLWWHAREHVVEWDLTGCTDDTIAELAAPKWFTKNNRILVESKDDLRKRIGKSPDRADALLLCFVDLGPGVVGAVTADDVLRESDDAPAPRLVTAGFGYGVTG